MASSMRWTFLGKSALLVSNDSCAGNLAKSAAGPSAEDASESTEPLPQTLVRIPTEHAPALQAQAEAAEAAAAEEQA